jgi:hypothetical protein
MKVETDNGLKLRRDLTAFLFVGAAATSIDFLVYFILVDFEVSKNLAKSISFLFGVCVGYLGNVRHTFRHAIPHPFKYLLTYSISLILNVTVNGLGYLMLENSLLWWILATTTSTAFNFFGLRHFAFTQKV